MPHSMDGRETAEWLCSFLILPGIPRDAIPLFSPVTSKRGTVIPEPSPGAVKPNPGSQAGEVSMHLAENVPCDEDLSPACDKGTVLLSRF